MSWRHHCSNSQQLFHSACWAFPSVDCFFLYYNLDDLDRRINGNRYNLVWLDRLFH
jgi:hypothetical protein